MIQYRVNGKWTVPALGSAVQLAKNEGETTIEVIDTEAGTRTVQKIEDLVNESV